MKKSAFTLIEIMISLSVVATLSVITLASYRTLNQKKVFETQFNEFISSLELAKKRAVSGEKLRCTSIIDHSVYINSPTSYSLRAGCTSGDIVIATKTFPIFSGLQFTDYTTVETAFLPLASGSTTNCIVLTDTQNNLCRSATINSAATISEGTDCNCP